MSAFSGLASLEQLGALSSRPNKDRSSSGTSPHQLDLRFVIGSAWSWRHTRLERCNEIDEWSFSRSLLKDIG